MAKRRPDPRVVTSALPPLARLKRKTSANADMNLHQRLERCDHTETVDGQTVKCGSPATTTYTVNGKIVRRCLSCLKGTQAQRATQAEMDMILRWVQARMHNNPTGTVA